MKSVRTIEGKFYAEGQPVSDTWVANIPVLMTSPVSATGFTVYAVTSSAIGGAYFRNGGAQNDVAVWDVMLSAGTWTLEALVVKDTTNGILTFQLDDGAGGWTTVGTIDTYAGALTFNVLNTITGISVTRGGHRQLRVLVATKNASASSYYGMLQHIQLRRTA